MMEDSKVQMPTCGTCLFSDQSHTGDLYCCYSAQSVIAAAADKTDSLVLDENFCGDGAWRPRDLGLAAPDNVGAMGYTIAVVNALEQREDAEKRITVVRQNLVGAPEREQ